MDPILTNISICDKKALITQHNGRVFFVLPIEKDTISDYQKKILESSICPDLIIMRFVTEGDRLWGYYDFGGYVKLNEAYQIWARARKNTALLSVEVILAIIRSILSIEDLLFVSDGWLIDMDTIFVRPDSGRIKLAYFPIQNNIDRSFAIARLIKDTIPAASNQQWNFYADEIIECLNKNESLAAVESKLREIGRELSLFPHEV